jgi:hypothetical protein
MQWFRERLINHDITHAESCDQVNRFAGGYDIVFLDHDLGHHKSATFHTKNNGEVFAHKISAKIGRALVVIHSYNHDGGKRIQAKVGGVRMPFRGKQFTQWLNALLGDA